MDVVCILIRRFCSLALGMDGWVAGWSFEVVVKEIGNINKNLYKPGVCCAYGQMW